MEWIIWKANPSSDEYAERLAVLLFSPDLTGHSGAIFDRKEDPSLPSPKLTGSQYAKAFLADSEALVARVLNLSQPTVGGIQSQGGQ